MKTFVHNAKALLMGVLFLTGAAASAQTSRPFDAVMYPTANPMKLQVNVAKNEAKSKLYIQLLDKKDHILVTHHLPRKADVYRQRFDMSDLKDGVYRVRITNGSEVIEKSFQMKTPGLEERLTPRLMTVVETPNTLASGN